jgi:hypothetical protein
VGFQNAGRVAPDSPGNDPRLKLSSLGGVDIQTSSLPQRPAQVEKDPPLITCASLRADELRGCLIREISRTIAIGLQAQAALLDRDDDAAIANLRRHWIAMRAGIGPLAAELRDLAETGGAP